jgi:hypothetical protein
VVNAWGRLIGMITTTSDASQTSGRDLRAITLNYINRDIALQTGENLSQYLAGDLQAKVSVFNQNTAQSMINQYVEIIAKQQ